MRCSRPRSFFSLLFTLALGSCVGLAPPDSADVSLPVGTRAEVVRVSLPSEPELQHSCLVACEDLRRVSRAHHRCLSRCPGASVEVGVGCEGRDARACFDRVVAVALEPPSLSDQEVAQATLAGLAWLAWLSAYIVLDALCNDPARQHSCGDESR